MSGYDHRIRPHISGPPLEVEVNIAVRSMGPVDELSQTFTLDCYFRQFWTDERLTFNGTASQLDELSMNWAFWLSFILGISVPRLKSWKAKLKT